MTWKVSVPGSYDTVQAALLAHETEHGQAQELRLHLGQAGVDELAAVVGQQQQRATAGAGQLAAVRGGAGTAGGHGLQPVHAVAVAVAAAEGQGPVAVRVGSQAVAFSLADQ